MKLVTGAQPIDAIVVVPQCPPHQSWSSDSLLDGIDELQGRFNIDSRRVYVVGYSMGAVAAWQLAADGSERIAAIIPFAGGGDLSLAARLKDTAIWAAHGTNDSTVSIDSSCSMVAAVNASGGQARLLRLVGYDHGIHGLEQPLPEMLAWLIKQRLSTTKVIGAGRQLQ